ASRLINKAELVIAEAHRAQCPFGEVIDLIALRRPLAGDEVQLVVTVEVNLVALVAEFLPLLQLLDNVQVAGCGDESREPVKTGHQSVLDLARRNLARPANDAGDAEPPFKHGSLAACERRLAAIGPGEILSAVVRAEHNDGVVIDA